MLRLITLSLVLLLGTAAVSTNTGCSLVQRPGETTTVGQYFDVQEDWIALVSGALILYDEGKIDQDKWDNVWYPIIREGNIALDELEIAAINGDETRVETLQRILHGFLTRLTTETSLVQ